MLFALSPFESDAELPKSVDTAIIGGGIIGVCTALTLAERGVSVAVFEKGEIGGEQSGRNWGWCRKMGRDPREIPLVIDAMRLWPDMNERVGGETGFRPRGILYACEDDAAVARREAWLKHAEPFQLDIEMISGTETAERMTGTGREWAGALWSPTDGQAEPSLAAPAIAKGARARGAEIFTRCAVREIETSAGAVAGVVTERGTVKCQSAVLAGGAWSRLFCGNLGLTLPQLKVLSSVMRSEAVADGPEAAVAADGFAYRKRLDGGYTMAHGGLNIVEIVPDSFRFFSKFLPALKEEWRILRLTATGRFFEELAMKRHWRGDEETPFELERILDPKPTQWVLKSIRKTLSSAMPRLAKARIVERWAGLIDVTPDAIPVISVVDEVPGFYIATGFSGHGFGIAPGAGRLIADLITGAPTVVEPEPFRFSRFSDGSNIELVTGSGV